MTKTAKILTFDVNMRFGYLIKSLSCPKNNKQRNNASITCCPKVDHQLEISVILLLPT